MFELPRIVVMASGEGTNFQAIVDSVKSGILRANIVCLVSNKNAKCIEKAVIHNIPHLHLPFSSKGTNINDRNSYENDLANAISSYNPDLIVMAGWMLVVGSTFINRFKNKIINLHPALPGMFPGKDAIGDAFNAWKEHNITYTGVMVHYVVPEVDAGEVISTINVPFVEDDTIESIRTRVREYEKGVLIQGIQAYLSKLVVVENPTTMHSGSKLVKVGKVRRLYDIGYNLLAIHHTDKQSAFDKHICNINDKGNVLTSTSSWWFTNTSSIFPNHFLYSCGNVMIVKKCVPFPVEVIVRGYITGSTKTSLWTHYSKGSRTYCGIKFKDGLVKNQRLDMPVVTPTTKGDIEDVPISSEDIVKMRLMNSDDEKITTNRWNIINAAALRLYNYGKFVSDNKGLLLVDTKYEFGIDLQGNLLIIDEMHTCDSSRYWFKETYQERFEAHMEPDKFDKDCIRDYVKTKCDPYNEDIPEIPQDVISNARNSYTRHFNMLTDLNINSDEVLEFNGYNKEINVQKLGITNENKWISYPWQNSGIDINFKSEDIWLMKTYKYFFDNLYNKSIIIIAGSVSDRNWVEKISQNLEKVGLYSKSYYVSAHKSTKELISLLDHINETSKNRNLIFITVAGMCNALSGVVACNTYHPVLACPPFKDNLDMQVNLQSSIQCPSNVPVMTVLSPSNAALCCKRILNI
mgnify:CR=1 FL=1